MRNQIRFAIYHNHREDLVQLFKLRHQILHSREDVTRLRGAAKTSKINALKQKEEAYTRLRNRIKNSPKVQHMMAGNARERRKIRRMIDRELPKL